MLTEVKQGFFQHTWVPLPPGTPLTMAACSLKEKENALEQSESPNRPILSPRDMNSGRAIISPTAPANKQELNRDHEYPRVQSASKRVRDIEMRLAARYGDPQTPEVATVCAIENESSSRITVTITSPTAEQGSGGSTPVTEDLDLLLQALDIERTKDLCRSLFLDNKRLRMEISAPAPVPIHRQQQPQQHSTIRRNVPLLVQTPCQKCSQKRSLNLDAHKDKVKFGTSTCMEVEGEQPCMVSDKSNTVAVDNIDDMNDVCDSNFGMWYRKRFIQGLDWHVEDDNDNDNCGLVEGEDEDEGGNGSMSSHSFHTRSLSSVDPCVDNSADISTMSSGNFTEFNGSYMDSFRRENTQAPTPMSMSVTHTQARTEAQAQVDCSSITNIGHIRNSRTPRTPRNKIASESMKVNTITNMNTNMNTNINDYDCDSLLDMSIDSARACMCDVSVSMHQKVNGAEEEGEDSDGGEDGSGSGRELQSADTTVKDQVNNAHVQVHQLKIRKNMKHQKHHLQQPLRSVRSASGHGADISIGTRTRQSYAKLRGNVSVSDGVYGVDSQNDGPLGRQLSQGKAQAHGTCGTPLCAHTRTGTGSRSPTADEEFQVRLQEMSEERTEVRGVR